MENYYVIELCRRDGHSGYMDCHLFEFFNNFSRLVEYCKEYLLVDISMYENKINDGYIHSVPSVTIMYLIRRIQPW